MKTSAQVLLLFATVIGFNACAAIYYVDAANLSPGAPFTNWTTAATDIQSAIDIAANGDLILVANGLYNTGGRMVSSSLTNRVVINKAVTVQSMNGPAVTLIQGNSVLGSNAIRCVYMTNNAVLSGFTLTNGGTLISGDSSGGGIYAPAGSSAVISNCVLVGNAAGQTGGGAYNGIIYNSSIILNSTYGAGGGVSSSGSPSFVTNSLIWSNSAATYGGGAWGMQLKNCRIMQNVATFGGGTDNSDLYGCLVASNSATDSGGGIDGAISIVNCTIVANASWEDGGGIGGGGSPTVRNSIIYNNTVSIGSYSNYDFGTYYYCCTAPMPGNGARNTTNDPGFISIANGDFHLQSNSICINSGNNSYISGYNFLGKYYNYLATDLDGNPRNLNAFVDIGAYEYQTPNFLLPFYWAQQYGLSLDGTIDSDGDGMNNWQEAVAGTNPTNAASVIKMLSVSNSVSGNVVAWQSVTNRTYYLQRSTNLLINPAFVSIYTNPSSSLTNLSFTDTTAKKTGSYFYRVSVQ